MLSARITYRFIIAGLFMLLAIAAFGYQYLPPSFYGLLLLLFAFVIVFGISTSRSVAAPVQQLLEKAKNTHGPSIIDEVEEISRLFETAKKQADESKTAIEALKQSADIKLQTKTILTDHIIAALEQKVKNRTLDWERAIAEIDQLKGQIRAKDAQISQLTPKRRKVRHARIA